MAYKAHANTVFLFLPYTCPIERGGCGEAKCHAIMVVDTRKQACGGLAWRIITLGCGGLGPGGKGCAHRICEVPSAERLSGRPRGLLRNRHHQDELAVHEKSAAAVAAMTAAIGALKSRIRLPTAEPPAAISSCVPSTIAGGGWLDRVDIPKSSDSEVTVHIFQDEQSKRLPIRVRILSTRCAVFRIAGVASLSFAATAILQPPVGSFDPPSGGAGISWGISRVVSSTVSLKSQRDVLLGKCWVRKSSCKW